MKTTKILTVKTSDRCSWNIGIAIAEAMKAEAELRGGHPHRLVAIVPMRLTFFATSPERYEVTEAAVFIELETP